MKYFVNFFGSVRNIKNVFVNGSVTDETNAQKGRRDVNDFAEVKNEPDTLMARLKTGHSP